MAPELESVHPVQVPGPVPVPVMVRELPPLVMVRHRGQATVFRSLEQAGSLTLQFRQFRRPRRSQR